MRFGGATFTILLAVLLAAPACRSQHNSAPASAADSSPPDGRQIFVQRCAKCHGENGEGVSAIATIAGPSLRAEHDPGRVMAAVISGPSHMPRFEYVLSMDEIHAVSNYVARNIADIPLQPGSLSRGGELFRTHCASCHRTAARGGALGFVGTNAPALTAKSAQLVAGAIRWGPGAMPAFPPSVLSDKDLDAVVTYIQYVQKPVSPGGSSLNWYGPVAEGFAAWIFLLVLVCFAVWIEKGGRG